MPCGRRFHTPLAKAAAPEANKQDLRSPDTPRHQGRAASDATFVRPRYWDGLRRGPLAGEHLAQDLRRMDVAYLERNTREHELTRRLSLLQLDPLQVLRLR